MALVVEDGTGLANAESYLSVADCDTYHSNRGNTSWASVTTANKEAGLRNATEYLIQEYRTRWKGVKNEATQALDWPRSWVYLEPVVTGNTGSDFPQLVSSTVVPEEVKKATAELALKWTVSGALRVDVESTGSVIEKTVDVITIKYAESQRNGGQKYYAAVDAMLSPFLAVPKGQINLVRS